MDYKVFLDTNIYDASNYSFHNALFGLLKEMAQTGCLRLRINSVVEGEVKKHIETNVKKAAKDLLEAVKNRNLAGFQKLPVYMDKLQIPNPKEWVETALTEFEQLLNDCNVVRISSKGIDVETIIQDYFQQNKPFEQAKPDEFKDAIIVATVVNDLQTVGEDEIYCVVSCDKGFREALYEKTSQEQKKYLKVFSSLAELTDYLCYLNKHAAHIKSFLQSGKADYVLEDAAREIIYDAILDIETASYGIDDYEVIDIKEYKFIPYIISISEEKIAKVAVTVSCEILVWYEYTDPNESYFDREEHRYLWQKIVEKEDVYNLSFDMILSLDVQYCIPDMNQEEEEIIFEDYLDKPSNLSLYENCQLSSEIVSDESDYIEKPEWDVDDAYSTCPDCGSPINFENDGGNGFCVRCASKH